MPQITIRRAPRAIVSATMPTAPTRAALAMAAGESTDEAFTTTYGLTASGANLIKPTDARVDESPEAASSYIHLDAKADGKSHHVGVGITRR